MGIGLLSGLQRSGAGDHDHRRCLAAPSIGEGSDPNDAPPSRLCPTAGSLPAYQDAPEFAKFVEADSARLVAAVRKIGKIE
jgi:hypothetical protein